MVSLALISSILLLLICLQGVQSGHQDPPDLDDVISYLNTAIAKSQIQKSGKDGLAVVQRGVYPCHIMNNFVGSWEAEILRREVAIFDNNAFVTAWVTIMLLETASIKNGPVPSDQQLSLALDALHSYHDKNSPEGDGTMVFWPQSYNSSVKQWYCDPVNVDAVGKGVDDMYNLIHKILDDLGLEKMWNSTFKEQQNILESELTAFHIPPDFDDTMVNIGLGSILSHVNPAHFQHWKGNNTNFTHAFQALKKYAYRPFGNTEAATIDPRSYFYMREYLHTLEAKKSPAAFVVTWLHLISEDYKTHFAFSMPFHVNNVDLTVAANVIYGITATILSNISNPKEWFDEDVQMIYDNTTNLLAWMVQRNFSSRPDLALTYYPSIYNFYWFTSRTLHLLQSHASSGASLPYAVLTRVMLTLSSVMRGNVTADLLKRAQMDEDGLVYFEDFLGNGDKDMSGKPVKRGEDRLCSTAMAVNTLLYTWMTGDRFLEHVPDRVKEVIASASLWLTKHARKAKTYNVVFSGSVKAGEDLPFFYPANLIQFLNGSALPPGPPSSSEELVIGVRGTISEEDYKAALKEQHFGEKTQVDFYGYNQDSFPFWSSEPFTYASVMLALTRYRALLTSGQL